MVVELSNITKIKYGANQGIKADRQGQYDNETEVASMKIVTI